MADRSVPERLGSTATDTIGTLLPAAVAQIHANSTTARLDAEILLAHVLGKNRAFLRAWPETPLNDSQIGRYLALIEARKNNRPIAYLTGYREFWSGQFKVSPDVLIPRPETELLIELALEIIPCDQRIAVVELGTGSGNIAVSLATERPGISILATDVSPAALAIARYNAREHRIANVQFLNSDWFESIPVAKYDLVISNPPYVAGDDPHLLQGDLAFEPEHALKSGPSGLDALERIADQSRNRLKPNGYLLVEHGFQQPEAVNRMLRDYGYRDTVTRTDLQSHPRATRSRWPGTV